MCGVKDGIMNSMIYVVCPLVVGLVSVVTNLTEISNQAACFKVHYVTLCTTHKKLVWEPLYMLAVSSQQVGM